MLPKASPLETVPQAAGWKAGWSQTELGNFLIQHMCFLGFYPLLFFTSPLTSPFTIKGEGRSRSHQLYFGARSINSRAQWWQGWGAHLGLQEIWRRASPKGSTSLSCFEEHQGRHTKDTNIFCMKVLHRMARQPRQDSMHKNTHTCPSLVALCTVFILGCKPGSLKPK